MQQTMACSKICQSNLLSYPTEYTYGKKSILNETQSMQVSAPFVVTERNEFSCVVLELKVIPVQKWFHDETM